MTVTELAILHLKPNISLTNPSPRAKLLRAKQVMENALGISGRHFTYYQGIEDPTTIYLLGDWQYPSEHWDQFIPSAENQELLELLKDDFDIPRIQMYHVDVPNSQIPAASEVMRIGWFRVKTEDKAGFEEQSARGMNLLNEHLGTGKEATGGGWRVENPDDMENEEQWVQLWGSDHKEEHNKSAQIDVWKDNSLVNSLVLEFELKTGIRLYFEPLLDKG